MGILQIKKCGFESIFLCVLLFFSSNGKAAEWSVLPELTISEIFTDNVTAAPPGLEESDFITEINPSLSLRRDAPKLNFALDYSLQALFYVEDGDRNNTFQQLATDANSELLNELLFFDARATHTQRVIDPTKPVSSNLVDTNNITNATTVTASPYARYFFSNFATTEFRYQFDYVHYDDDGETDIDTDVSDSKNNQVLALINSGAKFTKLSWALVLRSEDIDYENADNISFKRAGAELRYSLTPTIDAFSTGGYEDNDFSVAPDESEPKGSYWSIGGSWAPTQRTILEGAYGQRFFGDSFFGRVAHETRRAVLNVEYREDVTTVAQQQAIEPVFAREDLFGQPLQQGLLLPIRNSRPTLTTDPFLEKSMRALFGFRLPRGVIEMEAFQIKREYEETQEDEKDFGGGASWQWSYSPYTRLQVGAEWQRRKFRSSDDDRDIWEVDAAIIYQLSRRLTGTIRYRHFQVESDFPANESRENIASVGLAMTM